MSAERDPLARLREAWRAVEAPPPAAHLPGRQAGLEAEDPQTRAVVAWLRLAWQAVAEPAAAGPAFHLLVRRRRRAAGLRRAAAVLLLAGGGVLLARWAARWPPAEPADLAQAPAPGPAAPPEAAHPQAGERPPAVGVVQPAPPLVDRPTILASLPDRVELRSGPVRLTMLRAAHERSDGKPQ